MTMLGKVLKKAGDIAEDVVKSAIIIPNQSYKSVTGKDLVKDAAVTNTGLGKVLVGVNKVGIDSGHSALQSYANTATGGYASKVHEIAVPGIVAMQQAELEKKTFTSGILSKFENTSEKLAPTVGQLGFSVLKAKPKEPDPVPAAPSSPVLPGKPGTGTAPGVTYTQPVVEAPLGKPQWNVTDTILKSEKTIPAPVTTLSKVTSGLNQAANSPVGQQVIGILGKVVSNLATPKVSTVSQVPQQLALQGNAGAVQQLPQNAMQKAVFEGGGIKIETKPPAESDTWWNRNKSWALPVALAIPGLFFMLFLLFKRKR